MSHHHHRTDKTCLNCGAQLTGPFCNMCGQENLEPKETIWHIIRHFFEDITHFDGKFMSSLKLLLFKPGFLTEEYLKGRRASYLNPVRMYMFISAMFFLVLLSITSHIDSNEVFHGENGKRIDTVALNEIKAKQDSVKQARKYIQDSLAKIAAARRADSNYIRIKNDGAHQGVELNYTPDLDLPNTIREYDSIQKALAPAKRDGFIKRYFNRRIVAATEYQQKHRDTYLDKFLEKFFHSIPQMYFISLPVFAFILWLLNVRRRREYYYVADVIFTIHFYCMSFLVLLAVLIINYFAFDTDFANYASLTLFATMPVYLYIAMHRFYKQGWLKTLVKCFILYLLSSVIVVLLVLAYVFNSMLNIAN